MVTLILKITCSVTAF